MSAQEISTMIAQGVKPILVVLNNAAYVVERFVHGRDRKYNSIKNWDWQRLLQLFDPPSGSFQSFKIHNRRELELLLESDALKKLDKITLIECMMGDMDIPRALRAQADLMGKANRASGK